MQIPVELIKLNPEFTYEPMRKGHPSKRRSTGFHRVPVVLSSGDGYLLLLGGRKFIRARDAGATTFTCDVKYALSDFERSALILGEQYFAALEPVMTIARGFVAWRETYGATVQELAAHTGTTPGTIHQYESLVRVLDPGLGEKVDGGQLKFKEARAIADISSHERQVEIAQPFIDGRISSTDIERVVQLAKTEPDKGVERIISEVTEGRYVRPPEPPAPVQQAQYAEVDISLIENQVIRLAGELDELRRRTIPEYRRLQLTSSLRVLEGRVKAATIEMRAGRTS